MRFPAFTLKVVLLVTYGACSNETHFGIPLDGVEVIIPHGHWREASHWHTSWWILSAKNPLDCWTSCTAADMTPPYSPSLHLVSTFLRDPNTWDWAVCTPSVWSAPCQGQCGLEGNVQCVSVTGCSSSRWQYRGLGKVFFIIAVCLDDDVCLWC